MLGAVSLTKHVDIDQYKYSGYGIGFDRKEEFSCGNGYGRKVIIFGADLSNSTHVLVKILSKGHTIQQFIQKNCIQLILLKILKRFV